jgi:hypothetical protein
MGDLAIEELTIEQIKDKVVKLLQKAIMDEGGFTAHLIPDNDEIIVINNKGHHLVRILVRIAINEGNCGEKTIMLIYKLTGRWDEPIHFYTEVEKMNSLNIYRIIGEILFERRKSENDNA